MRNKGPARATFVVTTAALLVTSAFPLYAGTGDGDEGGGLPVLPIVAVVALVVLGAGAYLVFGRGDSGPVDGFVDDS